jgi:peptidoglycan/xylan/chitin deacetylase (PgdA/CDA1 family)
MTNLASMCLLAVVGRMKSGGLIVNEHVLTREQTRSHVRTLSRWFEFIGLEELPGRLAGRRRRPFCVITFDDGKRSNYTEAAAELERLGVPAVFYLTTGFLDSGELLWFDRRELLVRTLGRCPAGLELDALKQLPFEALCERLERACRQYGCEPAGASDDLLPMSWDEARCLYRRGFAMGAHGVTHAILTRESGTRAFAEIEGSLERVSRELGARCETFAFPNGNHTLDLARHARNCGARTVMTTEPTWADGRTALWRLPRVQLFGESSPAKIQLKIALAAARGALPNPDGTGRRYRSGRSRAEIEAISCAG